MHFLDTFFFVTILGVRGQGSGVRFQGLQDTFDSLV